MTEQAPLIFGYLTIEAAAILVSAVAAIVAGLLTIRSQRDVARARLTFETLDHKNWDRDYIEKRLAFGKLRHSDESLAIYANPRSGGGDTQAKLEGASVIRAILSDYENMAIGIRQGILDEEYIYRYMRSGLIRDWESSSPFVIALRNLSGIPHMYVEFEGLATQWQNNRSYHRPDRAMPSRRRVVSVE